jgi:hypothetical protein
MNKAVTPSRWFSGWRTAERPMQDDPADLGTAFGLEMSLNEAAREAAAKAGRPDNNDTPTLPSVRQPGLMQRLRSRRKTAD